MLRQIWLLPVVLVLLGSCQSRNDTAQVEAKHVEAKSKAKISVTSTAFHEGGAIPARYTCDGKDISPPIEWNPLPEGTKSFALIADDPDGPRGTWVHWVLFNVAPDKRQLPEGVPTLETLPTGARQGTNDFNKIGYGGPCPPSGTHRYFFKIYALDTTLDLPSTARKADTLRAMEGHVIGEGQLMGKYSKR